MNTAQHIPQDDLLLFALQFLPEEQMSATYAHLRGCEDCRRQVAWIQGDLAGYALTAPEEMPPAGARERLLRRVAEGRETAAEPNAARAATTATGALAGRATPDSTTDYSATDHTMPMRTPGRGATRIETERRPRGWGLWALSGWALAACALAAAGLEYRQAMDLQRNLDQDRTNLSAVSEDSVRAQAVLATLTDAGAMNVTLTLATSPQPSRPEAHASYLARKGSLVFVASHLEPLEPGKTYELWLVPKTGAPVPAGTFKPDAHGAASLMRQDMAVDVPAGGFAVTIEPEGGSQTPTLPIVMTGE